MWYYSVLNIVRISRSVLLTVFRNTVSVKAALLLISHIGISPHSFP